MKGVTPMSTMAVVERRKEDIPSAQLVKKEVVYETNGLNVWYGEHHALKHIHLSFMNARLQRLSARQDAASQPISKRSIE